MPDRVDPWAGRRRGSCRACGALRRSGPQAPIPVLEPDNVLPPTRARGRCLHQDGVLDRTQAVKHAGNHVHGVSGGQDDRAQSLSGVAQVDLDATGDQGDRLVLRVVVLERETRRRSRRGACRCTTPRRARRSLHGPMARPRVRLGVLRALMMAASLRSSQVRCSRACR